MKYLLPVLLLLASPAYAITYLDITNLPDLGTPATVTDSLVTYDSSAAVGDKQTEIKFSASAEDLFSGAGTWLSFANIKASMNLDLVENTALSTWVGSTNITTVGAVTATSYEGSISPTEMGYLNGVTSAIQTQITAITPTAYMLTVIDDTNEATFKATTNLEAGTDYNAYSALLADVAGLTLTIGDTFYYNGTNIVKLDNGTANYIYQANGAAAPSWTNSISISGIDLSSGTFDLPNAATDTALADAGKVHFNTTDEQLSFHSAADGEISGEVALSLIQHTTASFDPSWAYDQETTNRSVPIFKLGDDFPEGLTITEWRVAYIGGNPATELDADLICDTTPDFAVGAGATVMDVLDTTTGASTADSGFDSATCANGANLYIHFGSDPVDSNVLVTVDLWYYAEED